MAERQGVEIHGLSGFAPYFIPNSFRAKLREELNMKLHHRSRRHTLVRVESLSKRFSVSSANSKVVRYAVVGLGHIAQVAVLPAFAHAKRNSRLVALFSD